MNKMSDFLSKKPATPATLEAETAKKNDGQNWMANLVLKQLGLDSDQMKKIGPQVISGLVNGESRLSEVEKSLCLLHAKIDAILDHHSVNPVVVSLFTTQTPTESDNENV